MIAKTTAYSVGERICSTLEDAQAEELSQILFGMSAEEIESAQNETVLTIIRNKDKVIPILSMKSDGKKVRAPRSDKGRSRKAAALTVNTDPQPNPAFATGS